MFNTNLSINVSDCIGSEVTQRSEHMEKLMHVMKEIYEKAGGNGNALPYLLALENHDIKRNFYCGGIVSKDVKVLIDYIPSANRLNIKISSMNKAEVVMKYFHQSFTNCKIEIVK